MRALMVAIGSRGDMEPFLALRHTLLSRGHSCMLCSQGLTEEQREEKGPGQFLELERSDPAILTLLWKLVQVGASGAAFWDKLGELSASNMVKHGPAVLEAVRDQGADVLIAGYLARPLVVTIGELLSIPVVVLQLQPQVPTMTFPHHSVPAWHESATSLPGSCGTQEAFQSYESIEKCMWEACFPAISKLKASVSADNTSLNPPDLKQCMRFAEGVSPGVTVVNAYSSALVQPAAGISPSVAMVGALFKSVEEGWEPPSHLKAFLDAGPKPISVGFGSMGLPPNAIHLIISAIRECGEHTRAVLLSGGAKLSPDDLLNDMHGSKELYDWASTHIVVCSSVPHKWLLPQCCACICHGGAGTVHAGIRARLPMVIAPVLADQFFWGNQIQRSGAGLCIAPFTAASTGLTAESLAAAISRVTAEPGFAQHSAILAAKMATEGGNAAAADVLESLLRGRHGASTASI